MYVREMLLLTLALIPALCFAKPPSREEFERQTQVVEQLKQTIADEISAERKFAAITAAYKSEADPVVRSKVIEMAARIPGPELDSFLTSLLKGEEDAGLRSAAATALGRAGTAKCLPVLAQTAASDRISTMMIGDIRGSSSARRAATFALAQLAERFPELADKAAAELRALPSKSEPRDNESLADARLQALYQVTHDAELLAPFFERLKSADSRTRENGVVAFRFLKLKKAPPEIVAALRDPSTGVGSWAALVLGEIGDRESIDPLMAVAADPKTERGIRCNAIGSLGRMQAMPAADLMEKLLADPSVAANAAIALYQITGRKVKEFPEGYNADLAPKQ